jgi:hypothetical protein
MPIAPPTLAETLANLLRDNPGAGRTRAPSATVVLLVTMLLRLLADWARASPVAPRPHHTPRRRSARRPSCAFSIARDRTRAARFARIDARRSPGRRRIATWRAANPGARAIPGHKPTSKPTTPTITPRAPPQVRVEKNRPTQAGILRL